MSEAQVSAKERSYDRVWTVLWSVAFLASGVVGYFLVQRALPGLSFPAPLVVAIVLALTLVAGIYILGSGIEIGSGSAEGSPEALLCLQLLIGLTIGVIVKLNHGTLIGAMIGAIVLGYLVGLSRLTRLVRRATSRTAICADRQI